MDMLFSRSYYIPDNAPLIRHRSKFGSMVSGLFFTSLVVILASRWHSYLTTNRFVTDGTELMLRYPNGEDDFPIFGTLRWSGVTSLPTCSVGNVTTIGIDGPTALSTWHDGTTCHSELALKGVTLRQGDDQPRLYAEYSVLMMDMDLKFVLENPVPDTRSQLRTKASYNYEGSVLAVRTDVDVTLGVFESELNPNQNWTGAFIGTSRTTVERSTLPPSQRKMPRWTVQFHVQNSVAATILRLRQTWQDFLVTTFALLTSIVSVLQALFPVMQRIMEMTRRRTVDVDGYIMERIARRIRDLLAYTRYDTTNPIRRKLETELDMADDKNIE